MRACPGVSDPGYRLIQTLKEKEVSFTVLPGPSAVVTALVGSGLPTDAFFFGGFLPVKSGRKGSMLQAAVEASHTSIFYESPHRIVKTVQALAALDPDVPVCVARELTKPLKPTTAARLPAGGGICGTCPQGGNRAAGGRRKCAAGRQLMSQRH